MKKKFDGMRLIALRKERGLSGAKLGSLVGLTQGFISALERGEKSPSIETGGLLADVLGTSFSYLTGETDDPRPRDKIITENQSLSEAVPMTKNEASLFRAGIDRRRQERRIRRSNTELLSIAKPYNVGMAHDLENSDDKTREVYLLDAFRKLSPHGQVVVINQSFSLANLYQEEPVDDKKKMRSDRTLCDQTAG